VDNITATSAKIKVTHNGKMADSWYGLLTTDTTTREDELIEQTVAELIAGDLSSQLIFNKNYTKILSPLSPSTTYKYIAFGLTEDGVVYGDRAVVEFATLAPIPFSKGRLTTPQTPLRPGKQINTTTLPH
jgi:hypothetical protein